MDKAERERQRCRAWYNENRDWWNTVRYYVKKDNPYYTYMRKMDFVKKSEKPGFAKRNRENQKAYRLRRKLWMIDQLGGVCEECGYNKCIAALDFHHKDPSKKKARAWDYMRADARPNHFRLLCANCHRELHFSGITRQEK